MVQRYNLNEPPPKTFAQLVAEANEKAKSSKTGAHGIKDLGEYGDVVWTGSDADGAPVQKSVKRFSVELDDVTERAEALADKLAGAEEAISDAVEELAEVGRVTTIGPPPADPVIGRSLWVAPNGRVYRAVECTSEEEAS